MNLIFDLVGVVFGWHPPALLARELPERAPTAAAASELTLAFFENWGGDWARFDRGTIEVADLAPRIAARTGLSELEVRRVVAAIPGELQPIAATVSLLRRLRENRHKLFYLSNMPAFGSELLQRERRLFDLFDDGVFSARVGLIKPEPAMFAHALQRFGIAASDTVLLDDHAPNVEAARSLGLRAVLFRDAAQACGDLRSLGVRCQSL